MMSVFIHKINIRKLHFYLLGFVLINFVLGNITGYRLEQDTLYILKIILYFTGVILFFTSTKPFKKIAIYYLFYVISAVISVLMFLFGGMLLIILSSIFLHPIYPKKTEYESETIKIYNRFRGIMSPCCSYEVVENKLYIFEKHLGYINIEKPIDVENDAFDFKNNTIIYKHKLNNYKQTKTIIDTTEILNFE